MKYKVIGQSLSATCPCSALLSVEKQVNDYIENGYVPRGELRTIQVRDHIVAYQVVVKCEEKQTTMNEIEKE